MIPIIRLIIAGFLLQCQFQIGNSLQCYYCHSAAKALCGNNFNRKLAQEYSCNYNDQYCMKAKFDVSGIDSIVRKCATIEECQTYRYCSYCNTDFCNGSVNIKSMWGLIIVVILLTKLLF